MVAKVTGPVKYEGVIEYVDKKSYQAVCAMLVAVFMLPGCTKGIKFTNVEVVPKNRAAIYFYRKPGFTRSTGMMVTVDKKHIQKLKSGNYTRTLVEPGVHKLSGKTMLIDKMVEQDFLAGKTYYFRIDQRTGMWSDSVVLTAVPEAEAIGEMRDCCYERPEIGRAGH